MIFIGDVHGKYRSYKNIMKSFENTVQVGDMGVGFKRKRTFDPSGSEFFPNPPYHYMKKGNHRFIRGNHDNPSVCKKHTQCISDGHVENDMMFIGGAVSIDKAFRKEGFDWWEDEELSTKELNLLVDKFIDVKPRIMISHCAPDFLSVELAWAANRGYKLDFPSRTQQAFDSMFFHHRPKLWLFGHWHVDFDYLYGGTRFMCLDELSIIDIDMNNLMEGEIISYKNFLEKKDI